LQSCLDRHSVQQRYKIVAKFLIRPKSTGLLGEKKLDLASKTDSWRLVRLARAPRQSDQPGLEVVSRRVPSQVLG
jgi:hypothetical protein